MSQSRRGSFLEAAINVAAGYWVSVALQFLFLPMVFDIKVTVPGALVVSVIFTLASLIRSYVIRRVFNLWQPL